ncbi:MAG: hypothetical protein ACREE0_10895, partial [Phenylobacterium sp.]
MLKLVGMEVSAAATLRSRSLNRTPWIFATIALGVGLAIRYALRGYTTVDTGLYLIPWYAYARDHGASALGDAFTNYTPFFSYLLLISTAFDSLAAPLTIVKAISGVFELACALLAARMVWGVTRSRVRAAGTFAAVWLAPMTLFNGAAWGQSDSIWGFFILASTWLFMTARNGSIPFAVAVSVKLQSIFLGPFVLGMLLKRRFQPVWLVAIPATYLLLAVPVLLAGRDLGSVLTVYREQANTFHGLSMNAANLWWPLRSLVPYGIGSLA